VNLMVKASAPSSPYSDEETSTLPALAASACSHAAEAAAFEGQALPRLSQEFAP
jgi:hypothetical protein